MKIDEVLAQTDELQPNQYDDAIKISWLSKLDQKIYEELIQNYEKDADTPSEFHGYSVNDVSASLLADDAFADWKNKYLASLSEWVDNLPERGNVEGTDASEHTKTVNRDKEVKESVDESYDNLFESLMFEYGMETEE